MQLVVDTSISATAWASMPDLTVTSMRQSLSPPDRFFTLVMPQDGLSWANAVMPDTIDLSPLRFTPYGVS